MKIYLVRHTSVDVAQGICYGQTDVALNDTFETEANAVASYLKQITPNAVYSSPLSRCVKLCQGCGYASPLLDDRLKELDFGDWEMQNWDDVDMSVWNDDWINNSTPCGESFIQMYDRVSSFFDDLKDKDYNSILVFTHGGVISCARVYFEGIELKHAFDKKAQYGDIVEFIL